MKRLPGLTCLLLLAAALTSGCCHLRQKSKPRPPRPVPAAIAAVVNYSRIEPLLCTETNLERHPRFSIQRIEMPAASLDGTNRMVALDYYRPVGTNPVPVIVVLPIIGGGYPLEKFFCAWFARHGLAA